MHSKIESWHAMSIKKTGCIYELACPECCTVLFCFPYVFKADWAMTEYHPMRGHSFDIQIGPNVFRNASGKIHYDLEDIESLR